MGQLVIIWNKDVVKRDIGILHGAKRNAVAHEGGFVAFPGGIDEEPLDVVVFRIACPNYDVIGPGSVANPAFRTVEDPPAVDLRGGG